ncbi:hypothetical protein ALI144C_36940 [Actinosynnema sp. ALI-1.44]|uniref:STAS domain-containing protein n=1 Tax=Actinosynnema sp. ALI-1.44 TaxID=1933779 RepID=UPI00097BD572|nr:STAS domain-containing protein [Actinosynnema sp. ALI-1.44]ONI76252.1 hypothetical protein ALI144C_36940 [Actinosynnema sp. ALI-1.44]
MIRGGQSMIGISHPRSHLRITAEMRSGGVLVVRVRGEVDADSSRTFDHYLRTRLPSEAHHVVVDTSDITLLSARGIRTLIEHTDRLARQGHHLVIVQSTPHVRRVVEATHAAANLHLHDSLPLALEACADSGKQYDRLPETPRNTDESADEVTALRQKLQGLLVASRTKLVVARAMGVVQERYRLDPEMACEVVRLSAEHHHLRMYTLATALLHTAPPDGPTWFPGRTRRPAPSLSFTELRRNRRGDRSAVVGTLLKAATEYMRPEAAAVYLVEQPANVLRLELSSNMSTSLVNHLAGADDPTPTHNTTAQVVVTDIAAESHSPARHALLSAGIRAMHSMPLLTGDNHCVGVVNTYHTDVGHVPTRLQCARLDYAATEVATWLDWHSNTVVRDALERVHTSATALR